MQVNQGEARVRFADPPAQTKDRKSQLTLGGGTFKGDGMKSMFNQMAVKKRDTWRVETKIAKRTSAKSKCPKLLSDRRIHLMTMI